ncbi:MAG: ABC transporter permease [Bryobacteraceae bacterium]
MSTLVMPAGRLWGAYLREARYESVRMLRTPAFTLPFLLLPVGIYLFVVMAAGAALLDPKVAAYFFTGFSVFGVMGPGMFGFGMVVAMERQEGVLTLKRAWPMPPAAYLLGKLLMAALFAAIVMATMIVAATLLGHVKLSAGQYLTVAVVDILGALPFCAIGLFVGVRATGQSAPAIVNLLYVPMFLVADLWFPLPPAAKWLSLFSPAYYLRELTLSAAGLADRVPPAVGAAVLAALTVLLTGLAVRRLARVG